MVHRAPNQTKLQRFEHFGMSGRPAASPTSRRAHPRPHRGSPGKDDHPNHPQHPSIILPALHPYTDNGADITPSHGTLQRPKRSSTMGTHSEGLAGLQWRSCSLASGCVGKPHYWTWQHWTVPDEPRSSRNHGSMQERMFDSMCHKPFHRKRFSQFINVVILHRARSFTK